MSFAQESFNKLGMSLLRPFSLQIGLRVIDSDSNNLKLEADASMPSRGIGRWIILLSLLPFYSDFLVEPANMSPLNGYDFFNHLGAIPFRLCLTLPGLWILLYYGKVTRCVFDKENNTFSVENKSYISNQKVERNLEDISAIEVAQIEKPAWNLFGGSINTHIQVNLMRNSGETVSFIYIEQKSQVESSILKTRNMINEFLALPSDSDN